MSLLNFSEDVEASIWFTMIGLGIPVPDSYNISRTKGYKWDLELALNPEKAQTKSRKFISRKLNY